MERKSIIGEKNPSYSHGFATRKQGKIKEYHIWIMMRQRCLNPKNKDYQSYGGRGIKVCERWNKFENFIIDMGYAPTKKHSINRKENSGDYSPENCIWSTNKEQANNRRTNLVVTFNGESKTLKQWSESLNIHYGKLYWRYHNWSIQKAFSL